MSERQENNCITGSSPFRCGTAVFCSMPYRCCELCLASCNIRCGWATDPRAIQPKITESEENSDEKH